MAAGDAPLHRGNIRPLAGSTAVLRGNAPERSALTTAEIRAFPTLLRDATVPVRPVSITVDITPLAICITQIPSGNTPLAAGDTPLGIYITHAGP
jgi:hypothetical protein